MARRAAPEGPWVRAHGEHALRPRVELSRRIELETLIGAPPARCFDLSLSVEVHVHSTSQTEERVVGGVTSGTMRLGERVTWEARHFGLRWRLTTTISGVDEPRWFRDELVQGPFRRLVHDHHFELADAGTVMRDVFVFSSIVPPLDGVLVAPHLRRLLLRRNETIRGLAEGEGWREFVPER